MSSASLMSSSSWYSSSCCCILARISAISRSFSASSRRLVSRSRDSESSRSRSFASLAVSWVRRRGGAGELPRAPSMQREWGHPATVRPQGLQGHLRAYHWL